MRASKGSAFEREINSRFWGKVKVLGKLDCWEFHGTVLSMGYGQFWDGSKKNLAHRYSFESYYGTTLRPDICVLHACDNRRCVNPNHLFLGDRKDNAEDMLRKERGLYGENANGSILKEKEVKKIRKIYQKQGVTLKQLGEMYGVSLSTIHCAVTGKTWRRVKELYAPHTAH